jgi:hypothetical protein
VKPGDKVRVTWADGDEAVGFFILEERGFAVFEGDNQQKFVAVLNRSCTKMIVIEESRTVDIKLN